MFMPAAPHVLSWLPFRVTGVLLTLLLMSGLLGCSSAEGPAPEATVDVERSYITLDRTENVAGDGRDFVRGTVRVIDQAGTPMANAAVRIIVRDARFAREFILPNTDEEGVTRFQFGSVELGTLTIEAHVGVEGRRVGLSQRPEVTFVVGPPSRVFFYLSRGPDAQAGAVLLEPPVVAADDAAGHPVTRPFEAILSLAPTRRRAGWRERSP
ncbi:carboxypeptidase-like regulatory domain-containing protein [Pyxidicoccus sp. 3LG]